MTHFANQCARNVAQERNHHYPAPTMQEKAWRQKFNVALLDLGAPLDFVLGIDPPIELDADPVECALDEFHCLCQDAEPINSQE